MINLNETTLENLILAYINSNYVSVPPTESQFNQCADTMRATNSSFLPVSDVEFENIKRRLREVVVVSMDSGVCLPNLENGHKSWLPARRAELDFLYWDRYKMYLESVKHWNPRVTSKLGQVTDEILDQCGDPRENSFRIRGLILGDVQSGKTANYTALANKAADVGYDLIIVLAGIPELLRQQTQKRLDKELCGRQSNLYLDKEASIRNVPVGVGRFGNGKLKIASFTSEASDFNATVLDNNDLGLDNVNCPILLVVKKNKSILDNLCRWLKSNNPLGKSQKIEKSLFLIDDEADNASINTNKVLNPDSDPTAINAAIRELSSLFSKSTYLAVTATPFANIFIDPTIDDDLFPADFIYALDAPTDYIGADRIFDDAGDMQKTLVRINVEELTSVFPDKHKKDLIINDLNEQMYEATRYFLLINAIRDYRSDETEHRSMMIHVSRFIKVQKQISEILNAWLDQIKSDLRNYSKLDSEVADQIDSIKLLHETWDKFDLSQRAGTDWPTILHSYLHKAVAPIEVRAVNGTTGSGSLDYENHKEDGLRVIAIGGNTLSRGLTLEGLAVTYFYRNTTMYDTLMQMGRWFGYRPNYSDLVKIWLSQDAIDWYGQIYEATLDLKDQIYRMKSAKLKPRDFGLKVRQDPGSLIVTARNKMRTAKTITCPISVSGHLLETPRLIASQRAILDNEELVERFVDRLRLEGERVSSSEYMTHGSYFWKGVSGGSVSQLLLSFKTHPWHMSYNGKALADYVLKNYEGNCWDVAIVNGGEGKPYNKCLKCGEELLSFASTEYRKITRSGNILSVSGNKLKVGAGGAARIGLSECEEAKAKADFLESYSGKRKKPSIPDSAYLIKGRMPLLLIHIIEAGYEESLKGQFPQFLYALSVGFPRIDGQDQVAVYQVNLVELGNWIDTDCEVDE